MGYILAFVIGGTIGVFTMCACISAGRADDREEMMLLRKITCASCIHQEDGCSWCRLLDMPINKYKYCCWAEEDRDDT